MEIFVDINGKNGYQISNLGNIKSLKKGKECIKKPIITKYGYYRIRLCENSIKKYYSIHRLVASNFILNPKNKPCVNHINGIKTDNRVENLEWCTYSENTLHAYKSGLIKSKKGNDSKNSKISEIQALEIKENKNKLKQKELGLIYGISQTQINRIINGKQRK